MNLKKEVAALDRRTGNEDKAPLLEFWVYSGRVGENEPAELRWILIPGTRKRNGEEVRREEGETVEGFRARVEARRVELGL